MTTNSGRKLRPLTTNASNGRPGSISRASSSFEHFFPQNIVQYLTAGSRRLPGLTIAETDLLREKQEQLRSSAASTLAALPAASHEELHTALEAALIFAQYDAGTAVCVHPAGWVLTCAHCFGETETEWRLKSNKRKWLLFYTGLAVQVECHSWNSICDLALARIVDVECESTKDEMTVFPFVPIASQAPYRLPIICIGQPGKDDLESTSAKRTKYNLIEVSEGRLRGTVMGDPHNNSEIGSLKHDAWTYWGHSGAPLISTLDGGLVGLHSSWDDKTGMRHGIPLVAIKRFLEQQQQQPKPLTTIVKQSELSTSDQERYHQSERHDENGTAGNSNGSSRNCPIVVDD